jgi:hypothetical protein
MVAAGVGDDACRPLFFAELADGVICAAKLESADPLEVLTFQENVITGDVVEGAGSKHRRVVDNAFEAVGRFCDLGGM